MDSGVKKANSSILKCLWYDGKDDVEALYGTQDRWRTIGAGLQQTRQWQVVMALCEIMAVPGGVSHRACWCNTVLGYLYNLLQLSSTTVSPLWCTYSSALHLYVNKAPHSTFSRHPEVARENMPLWYLTLDVKTIHYYKAEWRERTRKWTGKERKRRRGRERGT